ncbi:hypothetical protein RFI_18967 [Reticulomyxa filosa]|uniref:ABC transporter domain-containing protein n=1 Tax=Reticulomyxa filosa TaxID=46433 RepID=X6MWV5_RETFI|nr:hypothetical protein RFI_18967 [Reticulomyxa filosa]|eukprot:ETO18309.1 hypothetical protein RFI_18967 [Reticulomyxa filosa]
MNSGSLTTYVILTIQIGFSFAAFVNLYSDMMREQNSCTCASFVSANNKIKKKKKKKKALGASERMFQLLDRQTAIPPDKSYMAKQMRLLKSSKKNTAYNEEYMSQILSSSDTEVDVEKEIKGSVEFENICFRYPSRPERVVLENLSWSAKPGTICALVGPSGGGKSTIVGLCLRLYDPDSGVYIRLFYVFFTSFIIVCLFVCLFAGKKKGIVRIDGKDLKEYDLRKLHAQIGSVSQEPVLFARTIYENITYGLRHEVSIEQVIAAAKTANAHEFIMSFPDRYDTLVVKRAYLCHTDLFLLTFLFVCLFGERGIRLSGGQKQRVAIARAILINPKILLLDEATSALDSESEYLVQQALDRVMVGRTVIVIAHRLSTVRQANQVLVVDQGQIIEEGTHESLIEANGAYAKLVSRQLLG